MPAGATDEVANLLPRTHRPQPEVNTDAIRGRGTEEVNFVLLDQGK